MRNFIFPILLLIVVFSFCLFSAALVSKTIEQAEFYLDCALQANQRGDPAQAEYYVNLVCDHWYKQQFLFGTFLKHDETDEVTAEFARLRSNVLSEDWDDFLSNSMALQATLRHIREMEWPNPENIL